jgi:hypothetical protein
MIEAGILLGLSRENTTELVVQTMLGTAKLLRDQKMHPVELREMVTSPGGTTIRAIRELEQAGVRAAFLRDPGGDGSEPRARRRRALNAEIELRVSASAEAARRGTAELLAEAAAQGGHIAVSGGSTPGPAYEEAATLAPDWSRTELWFADERCVRPDDERSNYRLVRERLLDRLERGPAAEHRVRGELPAARAADEYESELRGVGLELGSGAGRRDQTGGRRPAPGRRPGDVDAARPAWRRHRRLPRRRRRQGRRGQACVRRTREHGDAREPRAFERWKDIRVRRSGGGFRPQDLTRGAGRPIAEAL